MLWPHAVIAVIGATVGIGSMRAAIVRGDLDEAARQGALAGPSVVEAAIAAADRSTQLAGIAAVTAVEAREELLGALAIKAAGADRRTAIPAATAARTIARELARAPLQDDLAPADVARWRDRWTAIADRRDRWIEVRVLALDIVTALDRAGEGIDLVAALADPDPAFRRAAIAVSPVPLPHALWAPLAGTVARDEDPQVALDAAQVLCAELVAEPPEPILDALGVAGLARLRVLVTTAGVSRAAVRTAQRCVAAARARR